jgi:hypothetical protein
MQLPLHLYGAQLFALFGPAVHGVCRWVLVRLARPHLGPSGELIEAGADLSDNYISEYDVYTTQTASHFPYIMLSYTRVWNTQHLDSVYCRICSLLVCRYVIDFVILTAFLQGLSFLSNVVWLLWLVVSSLSSSQ